MAYRDIDIDRDPRVAHYSARAITTRTIANIALAFSERHPDDTDAARRAHAAVQIATRADVRYREHYQAVDEQRA